MIGLRDRGRKPGVPARAGRVGHCHGGCDQPAKGQAVGSECRWGMPSMKESFSDWCLIVPEPVGKGTGQAVAERGMRARARLRNVSIVWTDRGNTTPSSVSDVNSKPPFQPRANQPGRRSCRLRGCAACAHILRCWRCDTLRRFAGVANRPVPDRPRQVRDAFSPVSPPRKPMTLMESNDRVRQSCRHPLAHATANGERACV